MSTKLKEKTAEIAAERGIATHTVVMEDDSMIVTHWVFKPGEQTGWHLHDRDYMPIQLSTGRLLFEFPDGTSREVDYVPNTSSHVAAPVEHNAINIGDVDIVALEIEFKK
ncbi:MAG: cupin [Rhodospirillaceae bacterium]|jgi:mannose-6-phosphate isomerase-like protein (cupin superfamily)|nr:cupin [Rhodospirillaceae bacterium]MBT3810800.1 cupin [Rhodospirillaceae bacterium]MBT3932414.1 cupin [Rhodospirillaceae bacterium]MBT4771600.1 cupin [Rhodospirillaceae bacterium]MBT5357333.1 cupin [Rhodospirillaceae bacterium]